jgi:hypothetical protein
MNDIASKGYSAYLTEVCENSGLIEQTDPSMSLSQFFDWVYNLLFKNYRNEYIYKNVIANKILLGRHSLNTSSMLTEFRVGKCKADTVILNGTSTVYEIKSEYDSFARLENQLNAYFKVFDHINVITSGAQASKLEAILPCAIGIQVLTDRNTISTIRESQSNKKNINPDVLFDSLRKQEYLEIIKIFFGAVPDVPNTLIYRECKKVFCEIPVEDIHDLVLITLRKRNDARLLKEFLSVAPSSLSAYALSISSNKFKIKALMQRLTERVGLVLTPKLA